MGTVICCEFFKKWPLFMPPTLEKLKGHIALARPSVRPSIHPSVRPSVRVSVQNLLRNSFEISFIDSSSETIDTYFILSLEYLPLWSYVPFKGS